MNNSTNCKKYRIKKWLLGKTIVFTPQKRKTIFFIPYWSNMLPRFCGYPGYEGSEGSANNLIGADKADTKRTQDWKEELKKAKENFKGAEYICRDE